MQTLVGTLLNDRYRLDAQIGAGGMSTVYRAFDTVLERQVAIKLMHRHIAADSDQIERFRREARAVAQLSHRHIVTVIDAGEDEGRPYIVFEYIEGETLKDRIRRLGRLPVGEAVAYAIEIARALGCAHAHGIVHRDVKPQNVLIDPEGSAKVTDFGIARSLDEEGLTADGRVLGTTDYVSPEQAMGHDVTGQSDLYSLGVVLYEMLVGDVPFKGETQVAVAMKHVREDIPDVQSLRPEVSAAVAAVVERATDKDLGRRYADDHALVADLENALAVEAARAGATTGEATSVLRTLPDSTRRRLPLRLRHPWWIVGALALAGAIAVAIVIGAGNQAERGTGRDQAQAPPGLHEVSLGQRAADDYDPAGDDTEHSEEATFVVDRNPNTTWSTEQYERGVLNKAGVGIYVDASPGTAARRMRITSRTTGWTAEIYAAKSGPPEALSGWRRVSGSAVAIDETSQNVALDTAGQQFRYYLVWITKLPPGGKVEISEIRLYD